MSKIIHALNAALGSPVNQPARAQRVLQCFRITQEPTSPELVRCAAWLSVKPVSTVCFCRSCSSRRRRPAAGSGSGERETTDRGTAGSAVPILSTTSGFRNLGPSVAGGRVGRCRGRARRPQRVLCRRGGGRGVEDPRTAAIRGRRCSRISPTSSIGAVAVAPSNPQRRVGGQRRIEPAERRGGWPRGPSCRPMRARAGSSWDWATWARFPRS